MVVGLNEITYTWAILTSVRCYLTVVLICISLMMSGGNGNPLQYLPGESHGRRSLVGYSPPGCKELDMTERFHFTFT